MLFVPVAAVLVVLALLNVANNTWKEHWYVPTCLAGTVVLLGIGLLDKQSWSQLGLGPGTWLPGLVWGLACIGAVLLVYLVGTAFPFTRKFFFDERTGGQTGRDLMRNALFIVPFGTVLMEEVAFRGVLLAMVHSRFGLVWGIAVSSFVFGLWHILPSLSMHQSNAAVSSIVGEGRTGQAISVVLTVLGTAAAGVLFCFLRQWSGSLFTPMGLHWALNGFGFVFTWAIVRRRRQVPLT
ncbi:MAG TPA: CPBP family intramembrane glutamic endopeptidase [Candidatus Nanopelagicales bacterium]|jgi:membrane protease YdiL (CAAX protease family)